MMLEIMDPHTRVIHAREQDRKITLCGLSTEEANDAWEPSHIWLEFVQFGRLPIPGTKCATCTSQFETRTSPKPSPL